MCMNTLGWKRTYCLMLPQDEKESACIFVCVCASVFVCKIKPAYLYLSHDLYSWLYHERQSTHEDTSSPLLPQFIHPSYISPTPSLPSLLIPVLPNVYFLLLLSTTAHPIVLSLQRPPLAYFVYILPPHGQWCWDLVLPKSRCTRMRKINRSEPMSHNWVVFDWGRSGWDDSLWQPSSGLTCQNTLKSKRSRQRRNWNTEKHLLERRRQCKSWHSMTDATPGI